MNNSGIKKSHKKLLIVLSLAIITAGGIFMFKDINYCDIPNEILYSSEEESMIDEQRILDAIHVLHQEPIYDHEEVWVELGI